MELKTSGIYHSLLCFLKYLVEHAGTVQSTQSAEWKVMDHSDPKSFRPATLMLDTTRAESSNSSTVTLVRSIAVYAVRISRILLRRVSHRIVQSSAAQKPSS